MKLVATKTKYPNFSTRLIEWVEGTQYTHWFIVTDLQLPDGNPIVMHSSLHQGLSLMPMDIVLGTKSAKVFDIDLAFDWKLASDLMKKYSSFFSYGWARSFGHFLDLFKLPNPKWLRKRYKSEMHCSEFIFRLLQSKGFFKDLDVENVGPGKLMEIAESHPVFTKGTLLL